MNLDLCGRRTRSAVCVIAYGVRSDRPYGIQSKAAREQELISRLVGGDGSVICFRPANKVSLVLSSGADGKRYVRVFDVGDRGRDVVLQRNVRVCIEDYCCDVQPSERNGRFVRGKSLCCRIYNVTVFVRNDCASVAVNESEGEAEQCSDVGSVLCRREIIGNAVKLGKKNTRLGGV